MVLLQSCYTYKQASVDSLEQGKVYRVMLGNKKHKGELMQISDSTMVLNRFGNKKIIKMSDVEMVRIRKFSIVKTALIPVGIVVGLVGLVAISPHDIGNGATINFAN